MGRGDDDAFARRTLGGQRRRILGRDRNEAEHPGNEFALYIVIL
ncbi:hypothetical protein GGR43_004113 [Sphingobium jiangsuense]|uniref:Uncharacterized protein n=1 Tax=Sphingobium jiangsuense TaxID=870476 RepID=A0A7W6BM53_9SPHN|nr:hypothetical protein [Sphingobium jiangsuense]MBB3928369.1 hypothetical protein [Sphingobium jiangsuense]